MTTLYDVALMTNRQKAVSGGQRNGHMFSHAQPFLCLWIL